MSDEKTHESGAEQPSVAPAKAEAAPKAGPTVEHAPAGPAPDWTKHFEELFRHVADMPEKLVNALREAVPAKEQDPQENQANTVHQTKTEAAADPTPGKKGGQAEAHALKAGGKRPWGHTFLGHK